MTKPRRHVLSLYDSCDDEMLNLSFWPGLGLPRPKAIIVIPKINSCQKHLRKKKRVKVRSTHGDYGTTKRTVEITMHLGLDNIIKLKFTTNSDRCAILNVLNCLT